MYPASSGDPAECRDEEAADETQTTEFRVRLEQTWTSKLCACGRQQWTNT
jgi:hypothetical protein